MQTEYAAGLETRHHAGQPAANENDAGPSNPHTAINSGFTMTHHLPALITLLTVLLQLGMMANVGHIRGKHKVAPPACSGHPAVERALRIQMNTVESTLMFLPAFWMFALYLGDTWASILGGAWLIGRVLYAAGYQIEPSKRTPGFVIGFLSIVGLTLGGLFGVIRVLLS